MGMAFFFFYGVSCVDGWVSEWIWSGLGEDTEGETTKT